MNAQGRGAHRALAGSLTWLAAALISIAVLAPAAVAAGPSGVAVAPSSSQQARSFWTPARMKRAQPVEALLQRHPGLGATATSASPRAGEGRTGEVAPRAPTAVAPESSFKAVADPGAPVFRENGVIFFLVEGFEARCSGTSVNSPNRSVVFTAGHCVNEGGFDHRWYARDWVFVPGYRYGQRPFGVFPAERIDATRQWVLGSGENFDVGAAVVGRNENGQLLGAAVGGAGIAWNKKPDQVFDVHGYPVETPFDGETQRLCTQTPYLGHDAQSFVSPGPLNLAVDCEVTGGASGGGWTIDGNVLNGVTDYGYSDDLTTDFGAYFGTEVAHLYGRVAKGK
jgi:hypothetical protein